MTTDLGMPAASPGAPGTAGVPRLADGTALTKKDFTSDQEV
ncbi:MAG: 2-oxoacid:ferredoxin oxidoreductase subunit beta, partial [Dermatophilaceae bacterium]|nr:2-oxoacid:ferredoxin oxidoreductase subunit beta [Dermatophilaceae bacterium]